MTVAPKKNQLDLKDPFVLWGALLIGLGVGFGGVLGGAIGAGAGVYITQLSKKSEYSQSKKYSIAGGLTAAAVLVYLLVAILILGVL